MLDYQIIIAANMCANRVRERVGVVTARKYAGGGLLPCFEQLPHLLWMRDQIPGFVKDGQREKAMRWIGFMQGILWAHGLATIDEMKDWNRG